MFLLEFARAIHDDPHAFWALEEALDQYVMNTECSDLVEEWQEQAKDPDDERCDQARENLLRLDAGRKLLNILTAALCAQAETTTR
jgi:hypothetical protein